MRYDVVTTNLHVVSKRQPEALRGTAKHVRGHFDRFPDAFGAQEGIQIQHEPPKDQHGDHYLDKRYRILVTDHRDPDGQRHDHENTNPVLLKRWFNVESSVWHFGAPAFGEQLNHNPRSWHEVTFTKHGHPLALLNGHLSVLGHDVLGNARAVRALAPLARSHAVMAEAIADRADLLRESGRVVVVTADGNVGNDWPHGLVNVLRHRGYVVARNRIDFVAGHHSQVRLRHQVVIPTSVTHSDHEGLAAAFDVL